MWHSALRLVDPREYRGRVDSNTDLLRLLFCSFLKHSTWISGFLTVVISINHMGKGPRDLSLDLISSVGKISIITALSGGFTCPSCSNVPVEFS